MFPRTHKALPFGRSQGGWTSNSLTSSSVNLLNRVAYICASTQKRYVSDERAHKSFIINKENKRKLGYLGFGGLGGGAPMIALKIEKSLADRTSEARGSNIITNCGLLHMNVECPNQ